MLVIIMFLHDITLQSALCQVLTGNRRNRLNNLGGELASSVPRTELTNALQFIHLCSGERGTFCHGAHSVSRGFSVTIQFRYYVAM